MNRETSSDNIPLAVAAVVFTVFALSLGDALIKQLSTGFVLWQIFVIRSLLVIPVLMVAWFFLRRDQSILPGAFLWTAVRSLMLAVMWITYYMSLPHLPLSVAAAAYYTLPLFITLFSALLVGETVGKRGWVAVSVGFVGVLLILRPAANDFNAYALLPLISAMLFALAMILTRTRCRMEHPIVLSMNMNIMFVIIGTIGAVFTSLIPDSERSGFLLGSWAGMGTSQWLSMAVLATATLIGSVFGAIAYQNAPSSIVGTYDFAYVGFAIIWGFLLFDEIPDTLGMLGMALIVGAGILAVRGTTKKPAPA